jgi:hypothetical protein
MSNYYEELKKFEDGFLRDVSNHELTILRDEQLEGPTDNEGTGPAYRHLRIAAPNTGNMHYEIISVPYYLTMVGDMGSWTWSRLKDNFCFFRAHPEVYSRIEKDDGRKLAINPGYWAEKLQSFDRQGLTEFSEDIFKENVITAYQSWLDDTDPDIETRNEAKEDIRMYLLCGFSNEYEARQAINDFDNEALKPYFEDAWEWNYTEYTRHYYWACFAVAHAIKEYDIITGDFK